ncbi:MAG: hypothetical protein M1831_004429 [Alyxoria varia]|nr:MAG: hypothetical protein M1831_004429 [Alyxoria varia]
MDFLPVPDNPAIGENICIPLLCKEIYDGGEFLEYPQRHGWDVKKIQLRFTRHGKHVPVEELGAFLQTWLFFGTVFAFTGQALDIDAFTRRDEAGSSFLSTAKLNIIIGHWTESVAKEQWSSQLEELQIWRDRLSSYLQLIRDVTLRAKTQSSGPETGLICMSIAALGEYLHQAVKHVFFYRNLGAHTPIDQHWRVAGSMDCSEAVYPLMRANGWCPSYTARLDNVRTISVSVMWFYANMTPPNADEDHRLCSREQCQFRSISEDVYKIDHTEATCRCSMLRPEYSKLAVPLEGHGFPLITMKKGQLESSEKTELHVEPFRPDVPSEFVAISHVWSDGHGNPFENALPACFLDRLVGFLEQLPGCSRTVPFWIDTLCVPRAPVELRNAALLKLKDPFEKAQNVLVLDSYLQSFNAVTSSFREIFARIEVCGWMKRLWTFQEGRLGRKLWFQFKDQAVNIAGLVQDWLKNTPTIPLAAPNYVTFEFFQNYSASNVFPSLDIQRLMRSFARFRHSLRGRSTSHAEDEPICLASLMDLDLARILAAPKPSRMETFWDMLIDVPCGLVFSEASRKLTAPGKRWAPASLMGDVDVVRWGGPPYLFSDRLAKTSQHGLIANLPGMTFKTPLKPHHPTPSNRVAHKALSPTTSKDLPSPLLLTDDQGAWFNCFLESSWHQDSFPEIAEQEVTSVIFAKERVTSLEGINYEFRVVWSLSGILVTHQRFNKSSPLQTKAHRHVLVQKLGHGTEKICDLIKASISEARGHQLELDGQDLTSWQKQIWDSNAELQTLFKERLDAYGIDKDEESVWREYSAFFFRVNQCWPHCIVQMLDENTEWCVD